MDYVGTEYLGLKDRYTVTKHVASGGMGHVYEAAASKTQKNVMIKIPTTHMPDNTPMSPSYHATVVEKLKVEAQVLKNLTLSRSQNIVNYIDQASNPNDFFLAIEKLNGKPVSKTVISSGLPENQVIGMSLDVLRGLSFLHKHNTIYRDMKPDNIMVLADGRCVMIDFGAAKQGFTQTGEQVEENATAVQSLGWTCPHQSMGKASAECDLYALGRVMFYMGTGFKPNRFTDATGRMKKKMRDVRPTISANLSGLVNQLIDLDHDTIHTATDLMNKMHQMHKQSGSTQQMQAQPLHQRQIQHQQGSVQQQQGFSKPQIIHGKTESRIVLQGIEYKISNLMGGTLIGKQHDETSCQKSDGGCNAYHQGRNIFIGWNCPSGCRCSYNPAHMIDRHHMRIWQDDSGRMCIINNDQTRRSALNRHGSWRPMRYLKKEILQNHDQIAMLYNEKRGPYLIFTFYG